MQRLFEQRRPGMKPPKPIIREVSSDSVVQLNREAGFHPIPEDPRELAAAVRAGLKTLADFPYIDKRYGERGKRFADSDSAWLATLVTQDIESVQHQILWLSKMLAPRGMPRYMMEVHLKYMFEELSRASDSRTTLYRKLMTVSNHLKSRRLLYISESRFKSLAHGFEFSTQGFGIPFYRGTGALLISAVCDDKDGLRGSLPAIRDWLVDPARFSGDWIRAVQGVIEQASASKED
jgi:hypothetical protein